MHTVVTTVKEVLKTTFGMFQIPEMEEGSRKENDDAQHSKRVDGGGTKGREGTVKPGMWG